MPSTPTNSLSACWQIEGSEEQFSRKPSGDGTDPDLLANLDDDLASESRRLGADDLLATLLWDPTELRPDQGEYIREVEFVRGTAIYQPIMGWNEATRTIVAEAPGLLLMQREVQEGLALPVPDSAQALHGLKMKGDATLRIIKTRAPGEVTRMRDWKDLFTTRVMAFCWIMLVACIWSPRASRVSAGDERLHHSRSLKYSQAPRGTQLLVAPGLREDLLHRGHDKSRIIGGHVVAAVRILDECALGEPTA